MTKQQLRQSMNSLFGSQINPLKDEHLKGTKIAKPSMSRSGYWSLQHEITQRRSAQALLLPYCTQPALATEVEDKVKRILKLINDEDLVDGNRIGEAHSKKEALVELIQEFHKQYQSLYAQHEHLRKELRKKNETFSSSTSDSDSEYLPKKQGRKDVQLESEFQKITDGLKQELESTKAEVAGLKKELTASREEKGALDLEHLSALSKIQESEKMIADLKIEAKRLADDNEDLIEKLLNQTPESVKTLKQELDTLQAQKIQEYEQVEALFQECKADLKVAEQKIDAVAQDFLENVGSKNKLVADLKETIQELKRDVEMKEDQLNSSMENGRTNEERIAQLSRTITDDKEAHQDRIKDMSKMTMSTFADLQQRFLAECRRYQDTVSKLSEECKIVKTQASIETKTRKEQQKEIGGLVLQLRASKKHETEVEEKVRKLEAEASQEEREREKLIKAMKAKDEEKRQAIRQLCMSIQYHQSRYDHIKQVLSSTATTQIAN